MTSALPLGRTDCSMSVWLGSLPKSGNLTACHVHIEAQLEVAVYESESWR